MGGAVDRAAAILDRAHRVTYHEQGDKVYVNTYQDVEPAMDYAAAMRRRDAEERGRFGKRPAFHMTMSVPFNVIAAAAAKLGIPQGQVFQAGNSKRIMMELRRPEFRAFRTTTDRLIGATSVWRRNSSSATHSPSKAESSSSTARKTATTSAKLSPRASTRRP